VKAEKVLQVEASLVEIPVDKVLVEDRDLVVGTSPLSSRQPWKRAGRKLVVEVPGLHWCLSIH